jgi:hypothetical protein
VGCITNISEREFPTGTAVPRCRSSPLIPHYKLA